MAENCTHNCDTCKAGCSNSTAKFEKLKLSSGSDIKKIIGISAAFAASIITDASVLSTKLTQITS